MPATRLLFAQIREDSALPRMEEELVEDAEMAKLIYLIREKTIVMFTADWKSFTDSLSEIEKNEFIISDY